MPSAVTASVARCFPAASARLGPGRAIARHDQHGARLRRGVTHNIVGLVHKMYELGIKLDFGNRQPCTERSSEALLLDRFSAFLLDLRLHGFLASLVYPLDGLGRQDRTAEVHVDFSLVRRGVLSPTNPLEI